MTAIARLFRSALVLISSALPVLPAAAETERTQTVTCPVTGKPFRATLQASGTVFGVYLDMRPYGPIASPEPVATCPDASRFPVFKTLDATERARVRQIVTTPDYKGLIAAGDQPYYVIAHVKRQLQYDPIEVAQDLVQAAWQAQPGGRQHRRYLLEARMAFEAIAAAPAQTQELALNSRYFQTELSRQLGEFDVALAVLDRWFPRGGAGQDVVGSAFLAQVRAAVVRRDAGPVLAVPPPSPVAR